MRLTTGSDIDHALVLRNMARHLRGLADDVGRVAVTISDVTAHVAPPPSPETIRNLQKIDALHQSLCDLARLSDAMASRRPLRESAIQHLKLATTRALLEPQGQTDIARTGSVDLF